MIGPVVFAGSFLVLLLLGWILRRRQLCTLVVSSPAFRRGDRGGRLEVDGTRFRIARVLAADAAVLEPDP